MLRFPYGGCPCCAPAAASGESWARPPGGPVARPEPPRGRTAGMGGSSSGAAVRRGRGGGLALDPLHQQVAAVVLRVAARHGFALAGGNALMAHGVINRPTQ